MVKLKKLLDEGRYNAIKEEQEQVKTHHSLPYDKIYHLMSDATYASSKEDFDNRVKNIISFNQSSAEDYIEDSANSEEDWVKLTDSLYGDFATQEAQEQNFRGIAFVKGNKVIIAYGGTKTMHDLKCDDKYILQNKVPPKHYISEQFLEHVLQKLNDYSESLSASDYSFETTGHSLGAVLANLAVLFLRFEHPELNVNASIGFDNPGTYLILKNYAESYNTTLEQCENISFISYNAEPNFINTLNPQYGEVKLFIPAQINLDTPSKSFWQSLFNLEPDEDGETEITLTPRPGRVDNYRDYCENVVKRPLEYSLKQNLPGAFTIYEIARDFLYYTSPVLKSLESHKLYNFSEGFAAKVLEWDHEHKVKLHFNEEIFETIKRLQSEKSESAENNTNHLEAKNLIMENDSQQITFSCNEYIEALSENFAFSEIELPDELTQTIIDAVTEAAIGEAANSLINNDNEGSLEEATTSHEQEIHAGAVSSSNGVDSELSEELSQYDKDSLMGETTGLDLD